MDAKFTPPEHWEDWVSWALGIWLCLAPWALYFEQDNKSRVVSVITGVLLIATQAVTLSAFRAWEEWLNVMFGAWLIAAPWLLGIRNPAAITNFLIVGVIVVSLAGYELRQSGKTH
jgi:SPW repeat